MRSLFAEDEPDLGKAVQSALIRCGYVVDWVQDGDTAWDYLSAMPNGYSVAILDWMLPGVSGLELCQRLRSHKNSLPIMILTARSGMRDRVIGLDAGADDYLVKPFGMEELLARVRALQRRSPIFQAPQLQVGNLLLDYTNFTAVNLDMTPSQTIILTAKEFQLLEYFMQHPNQILTHDQIRTRLWDFADDAVSNVVAAQVRLLRRKLADCGCEDAITTIRGFGYRFSLTDDG
jgi:DNA-binding response OmpR family regulator